MRNLIHSLLFLVLVISLGACRLFDPEEELPAYVKFQNPRVVLDSASGFSSGVGIRNIWVYHGGFLQGTYPLKADSAIVIPYIPVSTTDFYMEGGIYESGQSLFNLPYPFWDRVYFDVVQQIGDTTVIEPVFEYVPTTQYETRVYETFDDGSLEFQSFARALSEPDSTTFRMRTTSAFRGARGGYIHFGPGDRYFEVINTDPFLLSRQTDTYIEITYRNSIPFRVGLVYDDGFSPRIEEIMTVAPKSDWNTVYVHLIQNIRNIINAYGTNTQFYLWLYADGEEQEGFIEMDDIRLIKEK